MLTGGQLAGLIVAVFWAILVSFLAYALLKLARLLGETAELMSEIGDQAGPLLDDMTRTVRSANEQLGRTDVITKQMAGVSQNVSAVTTVMTSVVGGPLIKAAAFSYGVRKALGNGGGGEQHRPAARTLRAEGAPGGAGGRPPAGGRELPSSRSSSRSSGRSSGRSRGRGRR